MNRSVSLLAVLVISFGAGVWLLGCQEQASTAPAGSRSLVQPLMLADEPAATEQKPAEEPKEEPKQLKLPIRVNAGADAAVKDAAGTEWLPDTGFVGGDVVDRGDVAIENTKTPEIYRTEHYGMEAFSVAVPNGEYTVKLHFAETYSDNDAAGMRVFDFNVEGQDVKDFDVFKEAGGQNKAVVKTYTVTVKDGKLDVTFTPKENNPEINAIEVLQGKGQ